MTIKIKGIDISNWQGKKSVDDFKKAKADGIKFVILRLGYNSTLNLDASFENNYKNAKSAGLNVGVYYYSTSINVSQAKAEANFCLKHLKGKKLEYPVFIDMEDEKTSGSCSKTILSQIAKEFCSVIEKGGFKSGVYASLYWLTSKIGDVSDLDVWVAQYNNTCNYKKKYVMWQYSSKGKVSGFAENIDVNYCYTEKYQGATKKTYSGTFPKLPIRRYFKKGDSGKQVEYLQKFLNWAVGSKLVIDGVIGVKTIEAIKKFQKKYELVVDGLFGSKSLAKAKIVRA